jgi:outer membrane receptor protein involved in Fe transport
LENLSIVKRFGFGKDNRYRLQVRGEFYNLFNRHYFSGPDTNINSSTFGYVTSTAGSPRVGQLAARVEW